MSVNLNSSVNKALIAEAQKSFSNDGRLDKKEFENLNDLYNNLDKVFKLKRIINTPTAIIIGFLGILFTK